MDWLTFTLFFLTCCVAASTGALFPPNDWYKNLDKFNLESSIGWQVAIVKRLSLIHI